MVWAVFLCGRVVMVAWHTIIVTVMVTLIPYGHCLLVSGSGATKPHD